MACSENGEFVAVGERNGCLHFMATAFQHKLISQVSEAEQLYHKYVTPDT